MQFASLHARCLWLGRRISDFARLARALARPDIGIWAGLRRFWTLVRRDRLRADPAEVIVIYVDPRHEQVFEGLACGRYPSGPIRTS